MANTNSGELTLNLNGNKLFFNGKGEWVYQSSDLDHATFEIEKLVNEKEVFL